MNENEYVSCEILEHGFDAQIFSINLCCRISKAHIEKLTLIDNYKGEKIDWDDFFKKTDKLREVQKSGKTISCCEGCSYLKKQNWNNEHYISSININNWIKCNADCIYCDRHEYRGNKEYKIYPIIKDLINKNLLKNPVDITIAGGEPTITSDFDKTLKILIKNNYSTVRVLTNAIKHNKYIAEGLKKGLVNILVSTDSGTEKTYLKIKKVNKHKSVWANIKKYVKEQKENSLVKTKYILIKGINDNETELKEFIERNIEAGVKFTCIDVEITNFLRIINNKEEQKYFYELYKNIKKYGENKGINVTAFDRMQIIERMLD